MFLFLLESSIKILLHVMLSTWISAIFFWEDYGNMTLTLPTRMYVFTWKDKRIALRQIPPATRSIKKRVPLPIYLRNQSDRNLRVSSFEETGTDVGDLKGKARQTAG